jgi:glyoxylase-like metal-dependent hydrolase (beta-lactamase superfamily II)
MSIKCPGTVAAGLLGFFAAIESAGAQDPLPAPRVVSLGHGIYVLHNPRANESWPQSNSMVVIGNREVLVVDANYLPGTAQADIDIIRGLSDKPVRYLVNTHWHYDHTNGNSVYRKEFPDLTIVAHPETRRLLRENSPRYLASVLAPDSPVRKSVQNSRKVLTELGDTGDSADRSSYERRLAQRELELAQLAMVTTDLPDRLVDRELTLDLGGRQVLIRHLGRGNTPGDLVVILPRERIVATGDLVVSPMPYAYNSSPGSWIGVLDSILALRPSIVVPGHGGIQRPADGSSGSDSLVHSIRYVSAVRALLSDVVEKTRAAYRAGRTVEEARASVNFEPYRRQFAGDDEFLQQVFAGSIVTALVDRAWAEAQGAT